MAYERLKADDWEKPPWELKVATGYGGRFSDNHKFGYNLAVSTAWEDVWTPGGNLSFLTSAEQMNIASSSADDGAAGTGALTIVVSGYDANYSPITETVTMNGVANVLTTNSFLRLDRMFVVTVGTNGVNVGNITATADVSATVQSQIDADAGQTLQAITSIPTGFRAIITGLQIAASGLDTAIVDLQTRNENESWRTRHRDNIPTATIVNVPYMRFGAPIVVPEHSDIKVRAIKVGAGNTAVSASFSYYLIDER